MAEPEEIEEESKERRAPPAKVVYEAIRKEGEHELERTSSALAWSGLAAGLSMGFSFVTQAMLEHHLPQTGWTPLLASFGYTIGFLIVVLGRQQLFTENTLTVILPLLKERSSQNLLKVGRLWSVVFISNIVGVLIFAWVLAKTGLFDPDNHGSFDALAGRTGHYSFGLTLWKGIFAGWLIALMVWLNPAAESARIWVVIIITYLVALFHFPHVIAGATEVFYLGMIGQRGWWEIVAGFVLPTLIGNTIGGVTLVAALAHAQVAGDEQEQSSDVSAAKGKA